MKCSMCGRHEESDVDLCVIHGDAPGFDQFWGLKAHHVVGAKEWYGEKEHTVSAPICAQCTGMVFRYVLEEQPKGVLLDFTSPDSEADAYKKVEALHHWLLSDREAEDVAGLVKEITGRNLKVRVYLE